MKKKIKLFLYEWEVLCTVSKQELEVNGKECKGCVHYSDRKIYVYKNLSLEDKFKVLRHELTHAVLYETQIELKEHYTEEDMCELMAKYGPFIVEKANELLCDELSKWGDE